MVRDRALSPGFVFARVEASVENRDHSHVSKDEADMLHGCGLDHHVRSRSPCGVDRAHCFVLCDHLAVLACLSKAYQRENIYFRRWLKKLCRALTSKGAAFLKGSVPRDERNQERPDILWNSGIARDCRFNGCPGPLHLSLAHPHSARPGSVVLGE